MLKHMVSIHAARLRGSSLRSKTALAALALLALLSSQLSAQYKSFWERFDFEKTASVTLAYDSNIAGTVSEVDDTILSGQASVTVDQQFRFVRLGVELTGIAAHYFSYDQLDYQNIYLNWIIDASERLGGRRLTYRLNFNIQENTETSEATQGQLSMRTITAGGEMSYLVTRHLSAGAGIDYSIRDPQGSVRRLVETETGIEFVESGDVTTVNSLTYSGWLEYQQSEYLHYRLTASHRIFGSEDSSAAGISNGYQDGSSTGLDAQIRGTLLPKVTGSIGVGFESRSMDNGVDDSAPTFNASLIWAVDEASSVALTGSQRYSTSVNGGNSQEARLSLNLSRRITRAISVNANASISQAEYDFAASRVELDPLIDSVKIQSNSYTFGASIARSMTEWSSLQLGANWTQYDSDFRSGNSNRLRGTITYSMNF